MNDFINELDLLTLLKVRNDYTNMWNQFHMSRDSKTYELMRVTTDALDARRDELLTFNHALYGPAILVRNESFKPKSYIEEIRTINYRLVADEFKEVKNSGTSDAGIEGKFSNEMLRELGY